MPKDLDEKQQAAAFDSGSVETGGVRVGYSAAGNGPVIVCLRADGDAAPSRTHELLAADHRVVVLGIAAGDAAPMALAEAIAALGIDRCTLMAASHAGTAALQAALRDPARYEAIVLVAPTAIGPSRDPALDSRLSGLELPVLALFGTRDRIAPTALARHYREVLPNGHIVMVYDAAHDIDTERPEATAEVVADFVANHERFLVTRTSGMLHP